MPAPRNAPAAIVMPTYDGIGQCVHPDVIDGSATPFRRRYVMVMEPYPQGQAAYENPSIVVSDDGVAWTVPPGLANPVVPPRPGRGWHSDAAILFRGNELLLYYRYNSGAGETSLLLRTSRDGLSWSAEETVLRFDESGRFASPSLFDADEALTMVYVDTLEQRLYCMTSEDGRRWRMPRPLLAFPSAWHACARLVDGRMNVLINDGARLHFVRRQSDGEWRAHDGTRWRPLRGSPPLLQPSAQGWDDGLIYHGSHLLARDTLHLWYSAKSKSGEWRIGYIHVAV